MGWLPLTCIRLVTFPRSSNNSTLTWCRLPDLSSIRCCKLVTGITNRVAALSPGLPLSGRPPYWNCTGLAFAPGSEIVSDDASPRRQRVRLHGQMSASPPIGSRSFPQPSAFTDCPNGLATASAVRPSLVEGIEFTKSKRRRTSRSLRRWNGPSREGFDTDP